MAVRLEEGKARWWLEQVWELCPLDHPALEAGARHHEARWVWADGLEALSLELTLLAVAVPHFRLPPLHKQATALNRYRLVRLRRRLVYRFPWQFQSHGLPVPLCVRKWSENRRPLPP